MKKIAFALSLLSVVALMTPSCSKNDEYKCTCTINNFPTSTGTIDTTIVYRYPKGTDKSSAQAECSSQDLTVKIIDGSNSCVFE